MNKKICRLICITVFLFSASFPVSAEKDNDDDYPILAGTKREGASVKNIRKGRALAQKMLKTENPLMVQINFIQRQRVKNPNGRTGWIYTPLTNRSRVKTKDEFFINLYPAGEIYAYILYRDSSDRIHSLYPGKTIRPGKDIIIPIKNNEIYEFDDKPGLEIFYVFLSKTPLTGLDRLIRTIPKDGKNLEIHKNFKRTLEDFRSPEGKRGVLKARIKKYRKLRDLQGKLVKIKPFAVWFKNSYTYKLVLYHADTKGKIDPNIKDNKISREYWFDKNLLEK